MPSRDGDDAPRRTPQTLTDEALVAAMDHPARVQILSVLRQRVASPAEVAKELGRDTNYLAYHFRRLEELGVIELAKVERTPGGRVTGRYYRAVFDGWLSAEEWQRLPAEDHPAVTASLLASCNADLREAVTAGTIHGEDNVIARIPLSVDRRGYQELVDLLTETIQRIVDIRDRCIAQPEEADMREVKVHIVHFESPSAVD